MVDMDVVARLRREALASLEAGTTGAPLAGIERIARDIAARMPQLAAETGEILMLLGEVRALAPGRDEIVEAIEDVACDDLSGCSLHRIADAVIKLCRRA